MINKIVIWGHELGTHTHFMFILDTGELLNTWDMVRSGLMTMM